MEEHAALLSMLTGPTSSLVLLLSILWAVWRAVQKMIPVAQGWVSQHLNQVDSLLGQHQADREAWLESMRDETARHQSVMGSLDRIERKVGGLYSRLPDRPTG
tara:strand:- start:969 stop:1277 length:309 start_codon:yes stop_codon:yes gene_type:complete